MTKNEPPPRAVLKILRDGPGIRITKRLFPVSWLSGYDGSPRLVVAGTIFLGRRLRKILCDQRRPIRKGFGRLERGHAHPHPTNPVLSRLSLFYSGKFIEEKKGDGF